MSTIHNATCCSTKLTGSRRDAIIFDHTANVIRIIIHELGPNARRSHLQSTSSVGSDVETPFVADIMGLDETGKVQLQLYQVSRAANMYRVEW